MVFLDKLSGIITAEARNSERLRYGWSNRKNRNKRPNHEKHMKIFNEQKKLERKEITLEDLLYNVMDEETQNTIMLDRMRFDEGVDEKRVDNKEKLLKIINGKSRPEREEKDYAS